MSRWLRAAITIIVTLFLAFSLTVVPRPHWADIVWPLWVALVVFYWAIALPEFFGITLAWIVGLFMDALTGTPLGAHALAMLLVAFIAARSFVKLRLASVWQQALVVCLALALYAFALFWIGGLTGQATRPLVRFVPIGVSVALWPIVFLILRALRRRFVASR